MTTMQADAGDKVRIGGIRLSREMVQLNCSDPPGENGQALRLFRHLAENRINIPFLGMGCTGEGAVSFGCLEIEDAGFVRKLIEGEPHRWPHVEWIAPVGTVTIFPHQSSLKLLGLVMSALGKSGLPIYGMGTSLSALTISTDYRLLDRSADVLRAVLDLPPNHAPICPEVRIRQIQSAGSQRP